MSDTAAKLYFDAADPVSYLAHIRVRAAERTTGRRAERVPIELRPPPAPLTDTHDPFWDARWRVAEAELLRPGWAEPVPTITRPPLVPWSRKAHELLLHARARGVDESDAALDAIFEAFFRREEDIGRVDVLVAVGRSLGLDLTETKAVLDVDRYESDLDAARAEAEADAVADVPVLVCGSGAFRDFHNQATLGTLLGST